MFSAFPIMEIDADETEQGNADLEDFIVRYGTIKIWCTSSSNTLRYNVMEIRKTFYCC